MVRLLLEHGAWARPAQRQGVTPLIAAAGIGAGGTGSAAPASCRADAQANAIEVIQLLLKAGADINARITDTSSHTASIARPSTMTDRQGQTALFGAISRGWTYAAQFLIDLRRKARCHKMSQVRRFIDALAGQVPVADNTPPPTWSG